MSDAPLHGWMPKHRAITAEPGPGDICPVLYANGKRISVSTLDHYPAAWELARRMAVQFQVQVKLLPMTAAELHAALNINPGTWFADPEGAATLPALVVKTCKQALAISHDQSARADAIIRMCESCRTPALVRDWSQRKIAAAPQVEATSRSHARTMRSPRAEAKATVPR